MLTQRLGSQTQLDPDFIDDFIRMVKENKGSCDEVWLATQYGFPPMETHRAMAEQLAGTAEKMRAAGLRVSLQISNSIGHGQYMSARDCSGLVYDGSPVQKLVGHDGTVSEYCFCWNDPVMRDYLRREISLYVSAIRPHTVWIDDDLRATNHAPVTHGCFCPSCMARFNQRFGTSFTREELVEAITHGAPEHRRNWVTFLRDGLSDFTYDVYHTIHEISPETEAGLQNGPNGGYTGYGLAHIYDAMYRATGKPPHSRPGGGAYRDHNPSDMIDKAECLSWQNAMLPSYVRDIRPEIESLPDVRFGKTVAGTCMETSLYLASGANAMSYAILMNDYEERSWHGEMLAAFAAHRPYWEKLARASEDTCQGGLRLCLGKSMWERPAAENSGLSSWGSEPYTAGISAWRGLGIPCSYDCENQPVYLLHPSHVPCLSDEEIRMLLQKPVFTSGEALSMLWERGFGPHFSAKAVAVDTTQLYERMTDHKINGAYAGRKWSQSFYFKTGYAISDQNGTTEPLGYYVTDSLNAQPVFPDAAYPYGCADAIVRTDCGAKWAVFGHNPWNNVLSADRRKQILSAIDAISDCRLTAVLETPVQSILLPRENADGYLTSVSVLNRTIGPSGSMLLRLRRPALSEHQTSALFMSQTEKPYHVPLLRDGEDYLVTMPSLAPWTVGTIFL